MSTKRKGEKHIRYKDIYMFKHFFISISFIVHLQNQVNTRKKSTTEENKGKQVKCMHGKWLIFTSFFLANFSCLYRRVCFILDIRHNTLTAICFVYSVILFLDLIVMNDYVAFIIFNRTDKARNRCESQCRIIVRRRRAT